MANFLIKITNESLFVNENILIWFTKQPSANALCKKYLYIIIFTGHLKKT